MSAMKKSFALIAVASMVLVAGCGNKEDKMVGTWQAHITIPTAAASSPLAQTAIQQITDVMKKTKLEVRKDHTYTINDSMKPEDGSWALDGDKFTLTPKNSDKKSSAAGGAGKDHEFTVSGDSKTITANLPQTPMSQGGSFTFTKDGS